MNGAIPLLRLPAFTMWTGKTLPFYEYQNVFFRFRWYPTGALVYIPSSVRPSVRPYAWKTSIVKLILHAIINTSHNILARKKNFFLLNATKENSYMGRAVYMKSHNENEKE